MATRPATLGSQANSDVFNSFSDEGIQKNNSSILQRRIHVEDLSDEVKMERYEKEIRTNQEIINKTESRWFKRWRSTVDVSKQRSNIIAAASKLVDILKKVLSGLISQRNKISANLEHEQKITEAAGRLQHAYLVLKETKKAASIPIISREARRLLSADQRELRNEALRKEKNEQDRLDFGISWAKDVERVSNRCILNLQNKERECAEIRDRINALQNSIQSVPKKGWKTLPVVSWFSNTEESLKLEIARQNIRLATQDLKGVSLYNSDLIPKLKELSAAKNALATLLPGKSTEKKDLTKEIGELERLLEYGIDQIFEKPRVPRTPEQESKFILVARTLSEIYKLIGDNELADKADTAAVEAEARLVSQNQMNQRRKELTQRIISRSSANWLSKWVFGDGLASAKEKVEFEKQACNLFKDQPQLLSKQLERLLKAQQEVLKFEIQRKPESTECLAAEREIDGTREEMNKLGELVDLEQEIGRAELKCADSKKCADLQELILLKREFIKKSETTDLERLEDVSRLESQLQTMLRKNLSEIDKQLK